MSDTSETNADRELLSFVANIVAAYVCKNPIPAPELPALLKNVHATLCAISGGTGSSAASAQKPAVPVKKSVTADYIVCLEDGKKLKMLKRYLRGKYDMSPDQYRAKWGLPQDYPMVAPNYSTRRSEFAKKIGLGRTKSQGNSKHRKRG